MSGILGANKKKLFSFENNKSVSTEVIDFQNDSFGKDLEEVVAVIQSKLISETSIEANQLKKVAKTISPEIDILEKLIFDRIGLKVEIITNSESCAALPFHINNNNILTSEFLRDDLTNSDYSKMLSKVRNNINLKGGVNLQTAKVSGIFSEVNNLLFINFVFLFKYINLSPSGITAIILHELGHIFQFFEYSSRLEENNQVLSSLSKELLADKNNKNISYIYKELKSINDNITEEDIDQIVNGENVIPGIKLFKILAGSVTSQMVDNKYNETSSEQLADQFVSRFGYGRELVNSLEKTEFNSKFLYFSYVAQTMGHLYLIVIFILSIISVPATLGLILLKLFNITILGIINYYYILTNGERTRDQTYDNINIRYKRIRNDMLELIKNKNIDKNEIDLILTNIKEIDKIVEDKTIPDVITKKIINYIIPSNSRAKSSITEQQLMEDLVSNDLFIKSAQLKNI